MLLLLWEVRDFFAIYSLGTIRSFAIEHSSDHTCMPPTNLSSRLSFVGENGVTWSIDYLQIIVEFMGSKLSRFSSWRASYHGLVHEGQAILFTTLLTIISVAYTKSKSTFSRGHLCITADYTLFRNTLIESIWITVVWTLIMVNWYALCCECHSMGDKVRVCNLSTLIFTHFKRS